MSHIRSQSPSSGCLAPNFVIATSALLCFLTRLPPAVPRHPSRLPGLARPARLQHRPWRSAVGCWKHCAGTAVPGHSLRRRLGCARVISAASPAPWTWALRWRVYGVGLMSTLCSCGERWHACGGTVQPFAAPAIRQW